MRWSLVAVVAGLATLPNSAVAAQCGGEGPQLKSPILCSKVVPFTGICGRPVYDFPDWGDVVVAVGAWESSPIRIVAASADAIVLDKWHTLTASIFAGNSFNADPMTPLRHAAAGISDIFGHVAVAVHSEQHFPRDDGMQFPAAGGAMQQVHLDVHLVCTPHALYTGSLSIWYAIDGQAATVSRDSSAAN